MQQISSCPVCKQHFHGSYVCILYLYNGKEFVILVPSHNVRNYGIDYWQNICYYSERGALPLYQIYGINKLSQGYLIAIIYCSTIWLPLVGYHIERIVTYDLPSSSKESGTTNCTMFVLSIWHACTHRLQ